MLVRDRRFVPVALGLLVGAVLVEGLLERRAPQPARPVAPPPSRPAPLLRPDLEKTPLEYFSDYWEQLAARAPAVVRAVDESGTPGVVIAPGLVVAPLRAADAPVDEEARRALLGGDGAATQDPPPRLVGVEPRLGLAVLAIPVEPAALRQRLREKPLAAGELVAALGLGATGETLIAPGHVSASVRAEEGSPERLQVALDLPPRFGVAALVDLEGRLFGVAVESGTGAQAHPLSLLLDASERLQEDPVCRAIQVRSLEAAVLEALGVSGGVLVESVLVPAFGPAPALHPGDVLLTWAGVPVSSPSGFEEAYRGTAPGGAVALRVLRDGVRRRVTLRVPRRDCRPERARPLVLERAGIALRPLTGPEGGPGLRVLAVRPEGPSARAGIREGDLVRAAVGGEARAALERYEKRPRRLLLRLDRQGEARLAVMEPLP